MKEQKEIVDHFDGFQDYWQLTRNLEKFQRDILFDSLPKDQQKRLHKSYEDGGWEDLLMRNKLDATLAEIKKEVNQDLLAIRCRIFSGKCYYMKRSQWLYIQDRLAAVASKECHKEYVLGGIQAEIEGNDTVCLTLTKRV